MRLLTLPLPLRTPLRLLRPMPLLLRVMPLLPPATLRPMPLLLRVMPLPPPVKPLSTRRLKLRTPL